MSAFKLPVVLERLFESGAEERHRTSLIERHGTLPLVGVANRSEVESPRLPDLYVPLGFTDTRTELDFQLADFFEGDQRTMVVLGGPGSGKTTMLNYLTLTFAGQIQALFRARLGWPRLVPFFGRLQASCKANADSLLELMASPHLGASRVERRLQRGEAIVLLDELDTVTNRQQHRDMAAAIEALADQYPDNWFIVTCRSEAWDDQLPHFRVAEIHDFSAEDRRRFSRAWFREISRVAATTASRRERTREIDLEGMVEAGRRAEALSESLGKNLELLHGSRTPLEASLLTLVADSRGNSFPTNRRQLFEQAIELLIEKWHRREQHSTPTPPGLSSDEKLSILRQLALAFQRAELFEVDLGTLESMVGATAQSLEGELSASVLCERIWRQSGIIVELAPGRFGFEQRVVLEYLADQYSPESGTVVATGGTTKTSNLAISTQDLRRPHERFAGCIRAFAAGDQRAGCDWIRTQLSGQDPKLRDHILDWLPTLGSGRVAELTPIVRNLVSATDEPAALRARAARALAGIADEPDAEVWAVLRRAREDASDLVKAAAVRAWCDLGRFDDLGLVKVPGGEFVIGSDEISAAGPRHIIYLPTYYIARYPVTVAEFQRFVDQTGFVVAMPDREQGGSDHPVVCRWRYEATEYARYYGYALPTEAEWEKAARGTDGRTVPWGNEWQENAANTFEYWKQKPRRERHYQTTPVGHFSPIGDSPYGCADMAGNVWEWTRSQFHEYPYDPLDGRENPDGTITLRGGACVYFSLYTRCAFRFRPFSIKHTHLSTIGFRMAVPSSPCLPSDGLAPTEPSLVPAHQDVETMKPWVEESLRYLGKLPPRYNKKIDGERAPTREEE